MPSCAILVAVLLVRFIPVGLARGGGHSGGHSHGSHSTSVHSNGTHSGSHSSGKVHTKSSARKDGTQVGGGAHSRCAPSSERATKGAGHPSKRAGGVRRDRHGKIKCSTEARSPFMKTHPCPSTGKSSGACPGYVVDHAVPAKTRRRGRALEHVVADRRGRQGQVGVTTGPGSAWQAREPLVDADDRPVILLDLLLAQGEGSCERWIKMLLKPPH